MLRFIKDITSFLLSHKLFPVFLLCIAIPLSWPLVHTGWFTDDCYQRAANIETPYALEHQPLGAPLKGPMRMYSFFDGDSEHFQRMLDSGSIPWWCSSEIRAAFWRPITAYFSLLDFWMWPQSPVMMHIHSMCWFVILIVLSSLVYRKIIGTGWAAGLAALLYVICDIQVVPIAFLANRHILIAAVLGIGSVGCYFYWREKMQTKWAIASVMLFTASLFSSESGIAVFGYLMSHAIWIEKSKISSRIRPLIPFILITIVWRVMYKLLGYGISGIEFYVDPGNEPLRFVYVVLMRAPMILLHALAFPPSDLNPIIVALQWYWAIIIILIAFFAWLFFPLYRNCNVSLFFLFGTLFSTIPLCAAFPGGRSLALVSFGMSGFLAQIIHNELHARKTKQLFISWRNVSFIVLLGIIFLRLLIGSYNLNQGNKLLQMAQRGIEVITDISIDDPALINQDVILVNPPVTFFSIYMVSSRLVDGKPLPKHIRTLGSGLESIEIVRTEANTLLVRPKDGYMRPPNWEQISLTNFWSYTSLINAIRHVERLIYDHNNPYMLGHAIHLTGVSIRITE